MVHGILHRSIFGMDTISRVGVIHPELVKDVVFQGTLQKRTTLAFKWSDCCYFKQRSAAFEAAGSTKGKQ